MVDVQKFEAHNVPEVEASSRYQRGKSLMIAKFCDIEKFTLSFIPSHVLKP
jgi:hypothetical protein